MTDRIDIVGARWSRSGAEAIVKLRDPTKERTHLDHERISPTFHSVPCFGSLGSANSPLDL